MTRPLTQTASRLSIGIMVLAAGCATQRMDENLEQHQFDPVPLATVGEEELEPIDPRSTEDLLRAADDALRSANKAQEAGDHEAALRQYTLMLELLIEADLDSAVFYDLRPEFAKILQSSSDKAVLAKHVRPRDWQLPQALEAGPEQLPIPTPVPARVAKEIDEIKKIYPANFTRGLGRSTRYLPYVREQFKKAGLPEDLAWLAMVESQFNPRARSRAGAGGMWQFMPATARRYGLRVDSDVDERYNWKKETHAAIAYLTDLHEMFQGNWPLAISAYNSGERRIEQVVASAGGERDLWQLLETRAADRHIRLETKKFYPKLCASILVAKDPERYGLTPTFVAADDTVQIDVKGFYSLEDLDKALGLSKGTLQELNPHLRRGATLFTGSCEVSVPGAVKTKFASALKSAPQLQPGVHVVKSGESPARIAARYGVSWQELMRVNNIQSARRLQIGQRLLIPGTTTAATAPRSSSSTYASSGSRSSGGTYRVQRGDCLYDIAKREGVSIADLQAWNGLGEKSRIHTGDVLRVVPPSGTENTTRVTHIVRKGECASLIAERYGVGLSELRGWNDLSKRASIREGQELVIYAAAPRTETAAEPASPEPAQAAEPATADTRAAPAAEPVPEAAKHVHTVKKNESPWLIASNYGVSLKDFLEWNDLTRQSVLRVGQQCVVYLPAPGEAGSQPPSPASASPEPAEPQKTHRVTSGESAWIIARNYGVSLDDFLSWNGLTQRSVLRVGDTCVVSAPASDGSAGGQTAPQQVVHTVRWGQNPTTIARHYDVSLNDLFKWNGWQKPPVLQVGSKVIVYE